jgi:hypothetical protein
MLLPVLLLLLVVLLLQESEQELLLDVLHYPHVLRSFQVISSVCLHTFYTFSADLVHILQNTLTTPTT